MAKRNLCYRHHCREFDCLSDYTRHLAAGWRTVEPCEVCEAEKADLLAALEGIVREGDPATAIMDWPTAELFASWAIEQARVALAGAEEAA